MKWDEYKQWLSIAEDIRLELFGNPKSRDEWANNFNIRGDIANALINNLHPLNRLVDKSILNL